MGILELSDASSDASYGTLQVCYGTDGSSPGSRGGITRRRPLARAFPPLCRRAFHLGGLC